MRNTQTPFPAALTDIPGIHHLQARSVTVLTESLAQAVTLDGEVCMQTPVEARVADEQLRIFVPEAARRNATGNMAEATWLSRLRLILLGL